MGERTDAGLAVAVYGSPDAPPVLAIHRVTGHGRRWRRIAEEGLPHLRLIAPDLPWRSRISAATAARAGSRPGPSSGTWAT